MSVTLMIVAAVMLGISGVPAVLAGVRARWGAWGSALLNGAACVVAGAGIGEFFRMPASGETWTWQWAIPVGRFAVGLDFLGVVFLVPIFLIALLGSVYAVGYWPQARHPGNGRKVRLWWGILAAAMVVIVLARDGVLFLMAWEAMALAAFMLVATEDHKREVRKAAWVYMVATHIGTLCLFAFYALLKATTGSFDLWPALQNSEGLPLAGLLILGLVGFGMKAGLFPMHVWLPGAHANAPSHVSAILSGVMLKMGVYGMFRVTGLIAVPPAWWGGVILGMGTLSAFVGIAYAVGQQDYKRLLAYSSIENVGIITMGLGLGLLGKAAGQPVWVVLGIGASLFHVLNHSLFKPLLFLGSGSLLHAVHTRRMDRLGGLGKKMPVTFLAFVVGGVAICGLPPLNGFASELLLYLGVLQTAQMPTGSGWSWASLAAPVLAAVGALAVAGFVKLVGVVFQGEARGPAGRHGHDPSAWMKGPMVVLMILCVGVGLLPGMVLPLLEPAVKGWAGAAAGKETLAGLAPLGWQMWLGMALLGGVAAGVLWMGMLMKRRTVATAGTWDCGYVKPTARMQYTGSSFGQMVVDLLGWALWPKTVRVRIKKLLPRAKRFERSVPDAVLDRVLLPAFRLGRRGADVVHGVQQGSVQAYLAYVLLILAILVLLG